MLVMTAEGVYEVHMLNFKMTFLHTDVEEDMFVKMVPVYETNDKAEGPFVLKLNRSLYNIQQRPKNWFGTIDVKLAVIGFRPLKSD